MRIVIDGVAYEYERAGSGPPIVVLHGFTGSIAAMRDVTEALAVDHEVVAIDLPGHGGTAVAALTMDRVASDLARIVEGLGLNRPAWFGYSLGGRTALTVAVLAPHVVGALVLEGASAGIADPAERAARVAADEALALAIERDGVTAFVDAWECLPLFATQLELPAERRHALRSQRLANSAPGLAQSLRGMGTGAQRPLHDALAAIDVPVLIISGERDVKFTAIARELAAAIPNAQVAVIPAAGHAAHIEQSREVLRRVQLFLRDAAARPEEIVRRS